MTIFQYIGNSISVSDMMAGFFPHAEHWFKAPPKSYSNVFLIFRCGVPSSCCKESYRMESGLIKIRCGFDVQDQKKYKEPEVKEKVVYNLISVNEPENE